MSSHSIIQYIRDHLDNPRCPDESFEVQHQAYQDRLDQAYKLKDQDSLKPDPSLLNDARMLLEQPSDGFDISAYQQMKTAYVRGYCYEVLDRRNVALDDHPEGDLIGIAADCYARAAEIAEQFPDLALVAQLKSYESARCYLSSPYSRRYRRAFEAAQQALRAWHDCQEDHGARNFRTTEDLHFQYKLADDVGVRAAMVTEDWEAVDAFNQAATTQLRLAARSNFDQEQFHLDELFLDWNWAALYLSVGKYEPALRQAIMARDKAKAAGKSARETQDEALLASRIRNFGRVNALIAEIALDCLDFDATWKGYGPQRLLNAAESASLDAKDAAVASGDEPGRILALLVNARWLGRTQWRNERFQMLDDAEESATALLAIEPITMGRVEIGRGDEYAYRYRKDPTPETREEARRFYLQAAERFLNVEALSMERIARKRLIRLL